MPDDNLFKSLTDELNQALNTYVQSYINNTKNQLIKDLTKSALEKNSGSSTTKYSIESTRTWSNKELSAALEQNTAQLEELKTTNDSASASISKTDITLTKVASSAQQASKASKLLGTALSSIKGSLIGSAIDLGINLLIDGVSSLIHHFHKSREEIIQTGEAAKSAMDAAASSFNTINTTVTNVKKNYAQLAQGVKQTGGAITNISLSSDEFNEFLSLNNQLAGLFPELTTGYDSQGNAILNLSGNIDMINGSLDTLIEKERQATNLQIVSGLPEYFDGVKAGADEINDEIDQLNEALTEANNPNINKKIFSDMITTGVSLKFSSDMEAMQKRTEFVTTLRDLGIEERNLTVTPTENPYEYTFSLPENTLTQQKINDYYAPLISANASAVENFEQKINQKQDELKAHWSSMNSSIASWLQTDSQYNILSNEMQSSVQAIATSLDWSKLDLSSWADATKYIKNNIFSLFQGENGQETSDAFTKMFDFQFQFKSGDKSIQEFQEQYGQFMTYLNSLDGLDEETKKAIELALSVTAPDGKNLDDVIQTVKSRITDGSDDLIASMSFEDLLIAYKLENTGPITWDELQEEIRKTKREAGDGINFLVTEKWNKFQETKSSQNKTDKYKTFYEELTNQKEAYDEGRGYSPEFKSFAAMLSPNNIDNPDEFLKNYENIKGYFTEGSKGLNAFASNLEAMGLAQNTGSDGVKKLSLSMSDFKAAAESMNMDFETFIILMDALQERGMVDDNYFGTMEEGQQHLTDLYTQLAEKKAQLSQLDKTDPENESLITALKADIDELNGSIDITRQNMEDLGTITAQSLAEKYHTGIKAVEALIEQYKQNEKNPQDESYEYTKKALQEALDYYSEEYGIEIKLDTDGSPEIDHSLDLLDERIQQAQDHLNALKDDDGTLNMDDHEVMEASETLKSLILEKQQLNEPAYMNIDTSGLPDETADFISKIQEMHQLSNEIEVDVALGVDPTQTQERLNALAEELAGNESTLQIKTELGLDELTPEQIIEKLPKIEIPVSFISQNGSGPEGTGSAPPSEKTQTTKFVTQGEKEVVNNAQVVSQAVSGIPDAHPSINLNTLSFISQLGFVYATLGSLNNYVVRPRVVVSMNNLLPFFVNGTAHAAGTTGAALLTGTAHALAARALHLDYMRTRHPSVYTAFAGGNWGLPYDQTALVGELAPEMLVRNGRWQLIGKNGAGFMGLKRGDIIFNHLQTRQLLENGWVTGRGRPVGFNSHVMGTVSQSALADGTAALPNSAYADTPITSTVRKIKEASEDFCDAMDYISIALDRMTEAIDHNKSLADLYSTYRDQNPELDKAIAQSGEKLKFSQRAYDRYMAQADASGLDEQYKKQIQNGQLDISNITDERLKAQIDDYQDWYEKAQDVRKELIDIGKELQDLNLQKLENITDDFDQIISYKKSIIEIYEVMNDLSELKGISISEDSLIKMMGEQTDISGYYAAKVEELTKQFNELVDSGVIVKNTDAWWEWTKKINEATAAMVQSNKSVLELKQNIMDIRMDPFENAIESIKDLNDEIKSLSGLINDEALFDDATGSLTNAGITKIGLYGQQLANSKQKTAEYANAINALKQNLANGNLTQEQYNEKLKEYSQAQRQAAADTKTAMDAIIKLAQDGIQKEVDAYSKLIDQKKADLKAEKSYQDYKKQLDDKQSAINAKKAERDAMLNDETKKQQVRKLNNEIANMQSDLDELVADHEYETKMQAYDDAQDLAKENAQSAINALDTNLDLQQEAISGMLKLAQDNYENVYNYLGIIADTYGTTLSEELSSPWETAKGSVANYMAAVGQANAQVNIDTSKIKVPEAVKKPTPQANEKEDSSIIHGIVNTDKDKTPAPDNSQTNNNLWAGIPQTPSTKGASWLNPNGSIYDRMYWNGYTGGYNNQSILYNNLGGPAVHGGYSGTAAQNVWMVEQLKARGFRTGGIAQLIRNSGEDGLAFVRNNEGLISPEHVPLIQSLLYNLNGANGLVTDMKNMLSASSMDHSNAVHINIDTLFNNEGSVTKDALPGLEKILNMAVDRMEHKITQACKSPRYGGISR